VFQYIDRRAGHYFLLLVVSAGLFLVNLGGPRLWDIDEGNNAECAREMMERGNWVVPTFNYEIRVDKPALLYWLQITAYRHFGVNEFSARLPSALASFLAVLLVYELGRSMFGPRIGLLAGLNLASTTLFCAAAHFANPDPLLNACTLLTLLIFWVGFHLDWRGWFVPAGISTGLAVLAKGPVGFLLPGAVVFLFLFWSGRLRLLADKRLASGILALVLVALPWYAWVGEQTRAEFLQGFFLKHNVSRFLSPMEGHRGAVFYYPLVLAFGYLPWSLFFGPAGWDAYRTARTQPLEGETDLRPAIRFLGCWIGVYVIFFSLSQTKLPNYILPVSGPVAILTARFLDRWRSHAVSVPTWLMTLALGGFALIGMGTLLGLLVAGGALRLPFLPAPPVPGLAMWGLAGLIPVMGAAVAWWRLARQDRAGSVAAFTTAALLSLGVVAANGGASFNARKSPEALARIIEEDYSDPEVRIGARHFFHPSLVFYCRREVQRFENDEQALEFLQYPVPVYLLIPAIEWDRLETQVDRPYRLLGRQPDFYRKLDIVVVTNQ
jgi:4-amino-4-deoxy-L-arabinose transferase-like glycosyltransferase